MKEETFLFAHFRSEEWEGGGQEMVGLELEQKLWNKTSEKKSDVMLLKKLRL
jgi:hypothetical protein